MRFRRVVAAAILIGVALACAPVRSRQSLAAPLDRLKTGNERFVDNAAVPMPISAESRLAQVNGQSPFAIVVSCADSRVPPEVIFNAGLGDIFVVRTAGAVADTAVLASVEYGAEHLKVPLLVVMGHEACGAVKTALETEPGSPSAGPNLDALVAAIRPGFGRMKTTADLDHMREAILANVDQVMSDMLEKSAIIRHLVGARRLQAVGAFYEFSTGRVRFGEPVVAAQER